MEAGVESPTRRVASRLVLLMAVVALIATSPAERELREGTAVDVPLEGPVSFEVVLLVNEHAAGGDWSSPLRVMLREPQAYYPADVATAVARQPLPAVNARLDVLGEGADADPSGSATRDHELGRDQCGGGCTRRFLMRLWPQGRAPDGARLRAELDVRLEFEDGGILRGPIPDGASIALRSGSPATADAVATARERAVPVPTQIEAGASFDPLAGTLITFTRDAGAAPDDVLLRSQREGSGTARLVLEPLGDGPAVFVDQGAALAFDPFEGCSVDQWCARDYVVTPQWTRFPIDVRTPPGVQVQPGSARLPAIETDRTMAARTSGRTTLTPNTPDMATDQLLRIGPEDAPTSGGAPVAAELIVTPVRSTTGTMTAWLGDASRTFPITGDPVSLGTWLTGGFTDEGGERLTYTAPVPIRFATADAATRVEVRWELVVAVDAAAMLVPEAADLRLVPATP